MIKSGLGPHVVGQRVVVRRVLRGETGPSGGPALTDLLGICESWTASTASIRAEDGTLVEIAVADIVSGKPVPPRPSRFARLSADEVARRCAASFRPLETEQVGDWVLRYTGGTDGPPDSILPIGDPGIPLDDALERARAFYARHDRTPVAQVVAGSATQAALEDRGWTRLRPEDADTDVLLVGVAQLSRALSAVDTGQVRFAADPALDEAAFASVDQDGAPVARARVSLDDDWALAADLAVVPGHRRHGLGRTLTAALTDWAAERGASVMACQVVGDNDPAQRLCADLGFARHHSFRYLTPGPPPPA